MPRNTENDPSVTISGGRLSRAIARAFNAPPAHPSSSATTVASGIDRCQSRQAAPKTTAARPIIEPTERSMPPVMMTGVNASASNPSSTLNRIISKKFPHVKKFSAMAEKIATSRTKASSRAHSPLGNRRSRQGLCAAGGKTASMWLRTHSNCVNHQRGENNGALHRSFPISADPKKCERRTDGSEQNDTQHGSNNTSLSTSDGRAAHHHGRDQFHFQTESGVGWNLIEPDGIQRGRKA